MTPPEAYLAFPIWVVRDKTTGKYSKRGSGWSKTPDAYANEGVAKGVVTRAYGKSKDSFEILKAEIRILTPCAVPNDDLACTYTQLELPITTERNTTNNAASD